MTPHQDEEVACWRSLVRRSAPYRPAPGDGGTPRALADFPEFLPGILTTSDRCLPAVRYRGGAYRSTEEIGWTGFAIPRVLARHGVLATGIIVGVLWGAWPSLCSSGRRHFLRFPLALYLFVLLFSILPAYECLWCGSTTAPRACS